MGFFRQKAEGLKKRWRHLSYGIIYLFARNFRIPISLWIDGKFIKMHFRESTDAAFLYEFDEICVEDCYRLRLLQQVIGNVKTIADIGANQGLFLLTARKHFPRARIDGYEPNPHLEDLVGANAIALKANYFREAVTKEKGKLKLKFFQSDLHTISEKAEGGDVDGISLATVIERLGGKVDILKIDCEGAEWELFEDATSWQKVNSVTMEYHLWARPGSSAADVKEKFNELGFSVISHSPISDKFGLITTIRKDLIDK